MDLPRYRCTSSEVLEQLRLYLLERNNRGQPWDLCQSCGSQIAAFIADQTPATTLSIHPNSGQKVGVLLLSLFTSPTADRRLVFSKECALLLDFGPIGS